MRILDRVGLLTALLLAASMWFYIQRVMIAHQLADAAEHDIPRGNLSDLYPRWLGARELLLDHRDPYSSETSRKIQAGYYGRPLDSSHPNDPKDQQGFAYPLYVVFLLAPTVTLPFRVVQHGFFWLLIIATVGSVLLWFRILRWHLSWIAMATVLVLTLGSFQILQGLKLQQLTLLVSALVAVIVSLLATGYLATAGILLAIATIKPQLVLFLTAWLMVWTMSDWSRRKNLALAFFATLACEVVGAEFLLPGWIPEFRHALDAYREYNDGALSILQVLLSPFSGTLLAVLILLVVAGLCWRLRREESDSNAFTWMTALIASVTVLVIPKTSPYNHVLLLPGILLMAQNWRIAWTKSTAARLTFVVSAFIFFWPWFAAFAVTLIAVFFSPSVLSNLWTAPAYTLLVVPFVVNAVLAFSLQHLQESRTRPRSASPLCR